jgi:hypothetical protein
MRTITRVAVLACAITIVGVGPSFAQVPDPNTYYRLSTEFRGTDSVLDVFNGGPQNNLTHLAPFQNVSGQFWRFTPNADGTYRMTTEFRGPGQCLDIFNGGANNDEPHLTACGNFTGQEWMVVRDGQWVRLKTKFRGDGMCLDVFNGGPKANQPHLSSCGNFSGQHWQLSPAKAAAPAQAQAPAHAPAPAPAPAQAQAPAHAPAPAQAPAPQPHPATKTGVEARFDRPTYKNGPARLDVCNHWATDCGKKAADDYCYIMGYERASQFEPENASPTRVMNYGKQCDGAHCVGFKYIICVAKERGKPKPWPAMMDTSQ